MAAVNVPVEEEVHVSHVQKAYVPTLTLATMLANEVTVVPPALAPNQPFTPPHVKRPRVAFSKSQLQPSTPLPAIKEPKVTFNRSRLTTVIAIESFKTDSEVWNKDLGHYNKRELSCNTCHRFGAECKLDGRRLVECGYLDKLLWSFSCETCREEMRKDI
jgi:hypothetical protein